MSLISSSITYNSAETSGGGVAASNKNSVTITESTITGNYTPGNGGGIFEGSPFNDSPFQIRNSTISGNTAEGSGGGIYAKRVFTLRSYGTLIAANSATIAPDLFELTGSIAGKFHLGWE